VGSLVDCLEGIHTGRAGLGILDKYDKVRRQIFQQLVDPTSTSNFKRIMQTAQGFVDNDPSYQLMLKARTDSSVAASLRKVRIRLFVPALIDTLQDVAVSQRFPAVPGPREERDGLDEC
jgi:hypothetical protein